VKNNGWSHLECVEVEEVCVLFVCAPVDVLLKLKCYLTLLRHVQAATVDRQIKLLEILAQWRVGDVLLCYSPDR
jgi:hypothetical protein